MTAEEIRNIGTASWRSGESDYLCKYRDMILREIAAQLAELNANLRLFTQPTLVRSYDSNELIKQP